MIEAIEVKGAWMGGRAVSLPRAARRRVQGELKTLALERTVSMRGTIRELDKDNLSFILRDPPNQPDVRAVFSEELFDEIMNFFNDDAQVLVMGVQRGGKLHVSVVVAAPTLKGS